MPSDFDRRRFRRSAPYYAIGRPPYPAALIRRVADICRLRPTDRLLDLGCGPGMLAIAFAPFVTEVVGMDPEPEMLSRATDSARGVPNVRFVPGSSFDLDPAHGPFRLVTMGRSFHWMDRAETLRRLDTMIEPDGAVALFGDTHPELPDNAWRPAYRAVLRRYGHDGAASPHRHPGWVRHEGVLLDSAFSRLESVSVIERRRTDLPSLLRRALSQSSIATAGAESRAAELTDDLRAALAPFMRDGRITEVVDAYGLMAWRPRTDRSP